ncbi:MAG TPA: hypothetical protein VFN64_06945 [Burkholderiaceae bacterium]|nr:hypothetical protein [Burkholderiaceae bacterium]
MDERTLQERHLTGVTRRRFSLGVCLGVLTTLAGCGGTFEDLPPDPATEPSAGTSTGTRESSSWDVVPNRALSLSAGASFDLAATLPANIAPGGRFDVDPSGAPLPPGITLMPSGLLTVSGSATGGTAGVVFRYTPPA